MSSHISNTSKHKSKQGPTSLVFTFIAPSLFSFCIGCISQVRSFHILFHRVFASFMAISHPFSQDHTFCRDLFFYIFTGYFTGKFISHFLFSVLSVVQTHIIFICFSLFISHTIYVKKHVNRCTVFTGISHSFHRAFSHTCEKSCEILCENYVKYLWKLCICSHGFHSW